MKELKETIAVIDWIDENYPDTIKFNVNEQDIRSIAVYLDYNKPETYTTMILMYGILFTLSVLKYYETIEDFEKCYMILSGIKRCNGLYGCGLPTHINSDWVKENIKLSPLQLLERHFKNK